MKLVQIDVLHSLFPIRAPCRPNPSGCLPAVQGNALDVADVDVLDGTPLLDIKLYAARFDHFPVSRNGWPGEVDTGRTRADNRFSLQHQGSKQ